MHWYNAAMSKPFQFSMQRMFVAIAWLSLAAASVNAYSWLGLALAVELGTVSIGAAIGTMFGRTITGILYACGLIVVMLASVIVSYLVMP
ncbi:MAG TPA: hypothetical protein VGY55_10120 [Pirellulales bacterium]|jgi:hypothetical protein|nr:hypothetical protein [Pirellulales bacterium]